MRYVNVFKSNTDEHRLKCINRMRAMIYDAYNNPVFIMIYQDTCDCFWDIVKIVSEQTYIIKLL